MWKRRRLLWKCIVKDLWDATDIEFNKKINAVGAHPSEEQIKEFWCQLFGARGGEECKSLTPNNVRAS